MLNELCFNLLYIQKEVSLSGYLSIPVHQQEPKWEKPPSIYEGPVFNKFIHIN